MGARMEIFVRQLVDGHILYHEAVREFKKVFVLKVLRDNNQNQTKTARVLGMHRNTLSRTLAGLGIKEKRRPPQRAVA